MATQPLDRGQRHVGIAMTLPLLTALWGGCGGTGPGAGGVARDRELLARLEVVLGHAMGNYQIEIDQGGRCVALIDYADPGEPVGYFGRVLRAGELLRLKQAVQGALQVLPEPYIPVPIPPESSVCHLSLQLLNASTTVTFAQIPYGFVPEAVRPLYWLDEGTAREEGLLADLLADALLHPTEAVVLHASTEVTGYQTREVIPVHMAVRSVGTRAATFATLESREIVSGLVRVTDLASWQVWESRFGGDLVYRPIDHLTPEARRDLGRVVTLAPGEEYRFVLPASIRLDDVGTHQLSVVLATTERYESEILTHALLGRRLVSGLLRAPLFSVKIDD